MAQIIAPNKDYTGESASVSFVKGVGETSDAYLIEWFKTHGYTVIEDEAADVPDINESEEQAEVPPAEPETVESEAEAEDTAEQVESEPEAEEQVEEVPEKPKRTRSSRAKAADAE